MVLEQFSPENRRVLHVTQLCASLLVSLKKTYIFLSIEVPISMFTVLFVLSKHTTFCYTYVMHAYRLNYISLYKCNNLVLELTIVPSTRTDRSGFEIFDLML